MAYFIGIDIHKKTSHIVVFDGERNLAVLDKNIRTKRDRFDDELAPFVPAKVLIESSTLSRWVADHLRAQGHEVVVGNPNYALMYASRPANRKNDREDARALAVACQAGHFKAVHRVSDEHRATEEVLGSRALVIESRTMYVNRIRALYAGKGLVLPIGAAEGFRARVSLAGLPPQLESAVKPLLEMLAMVEDQCVVLDRRIAGLAAQHPVAQLFMTVPGIGPVVALAFIVTIDDPKRFGGAHLLESYLGLVPKLHTSGSAGQGGHISKMGATYLRAMLVQAAWSLLRSNDERARPLQDWTNAIGQRRGPKVAIVALARRLAGVLYAIWRDGKPFELKTPKVPSASGGASVKPLVRKYKLKSSRATPPIAPAA